GYKNELYFDVSFALKLYQITILHVSGSALSATGNRLGRTPDPHRCNIDGLRPPANRVTACSVRIGFTGGWRGSWRPESPWLEVSARLTS
ncbi:hypothetical protein, partial [Escherichia coli]|uniref:hypothetical protein n=1 Tax=Escherichia coli TaxID=562 RepID=UPI002283705B